MVLLVVVLAMPSIDGAPRVPKWRGGPLVGGFAERGAVS